MSAIPKWKSVAKTTILVCVVGLFVGTLGSQLYFEFHDCAVRPVKADVTTGRTIPVWYRTCGCRYIDGSELALKDFLRYRLFPTSTISLFLYFALGVGFVRNSPKAQPKYTKV
jgi:hypothetical protein